MALVPTTASVPDEERLAHWRDALGRALAPMAVTARHEGPFEGRVSTQRLGYLRIATIEADAQRLSRTPAHLTGTDPAVACVAVGVQTAGTATLIQDGRAGLRGRGRPHGLRHGAAVRPGLPGALHHPCRPPAAAGARPAGGGPAPGHRDHDRRDDGLRRPAGELPDLADRLGPALCPGRRHQAGHGCRGPLRHPGRGADPGRRDTGREPGGPPRSAGSRPHRPPPRRSGPLPGVRRGGAPHLRALSAPAVRGRGHHGGPADPAAPSGALRPRAAPARRGGSHGVGGRPALGLRQPGPLQPRLPRGLRTLPA